ncbi:MAG: hypothetical protein IMW94_10605 [Thermoanaerobacter sp.]|nr:hypothetical protein [Thermoanaerobacter sp.]
MGAFGGLILTNKGRNLQAKAQTGVQLNFTKIKIGDGSLSGQSIVDLTDLISTKKELTILGLQTLTGGKVKLRSYLSNTDITTGFYWRELGVFARDPQEGEILYCYGNAGANAEYIPAGGGPDVVERYINIITLIGNASNISATLGSEIYVTQVDFDSHKGAATLDHPDNSVTDQKIGDRSADPALVPASDGPGKLTEWISWFANRIKAITGKANWWDAPDTTLAAAKSHIDAAAPHSGHALASDLASHLAETVITANKTINVPADYPTIQAALDSLKKAWIPRDVTVTIQVAAGTYSHTSPIIIDHPQGLHIKIIGATPVTTTITGVGTITGAAGNWSVPILVQSTSGIAAGDYVIIKGTTGTGDHYAFRGIWKVVSVDSATQITVQNTHRASTFPAATLSGGTVVALKTVLKFAGCRGIVVAPNSALGLLDAVAVVGDGSVNEGILVGRLPSDLGVPGPAFILLGSNVGVNGFGADGIWAGYGGTVSAYSGIASSGNGQNGFLAGDGGAIWAGSSTATNNKDRGFAATNGGAIDANRSTASGNINSDYYAWLESSIYVYGYTGAPTFSPAVNTVGNQNAIIST